MGLLRASLLTRMTVIMVVMGIIGGLPIIRIAGIIQAISNA
jgi:hypothetical protein